MSGSIVDAAPAVRTAATTVAAVGAAPRPHRAPPHAGPAAADDDICPRAGAVASWEIDLRHSRLWRSTGHHPIFGHDTPAAGCDHAAFIAFVVPEHRHIPTRAFRAAVAGRRAIVFECRIHRPDGERRWIAVHGHTHCDGAGRPVRMVGVLRDVTDDHHAEDARRHAEAEALRAHRAKATFLAAASHDLRQPLHALNLYVAALAAKGRPDDHAVLGGIDGCLAALNELLADMLELSKLDAGLVTAQPADFAVDAAVAAVVAAHTPDAHAKGLAIVAIPSRLAVHTDRPLLERMLADLVANAVRYTAHGRVLVGCRRVGRQLRLEVWDSGRGIAADRLDDIFEDFVQIDNPARNREHGTGLGLAIVRRLSTLLGHAVTVRSTPGRGSVFAITVPLAAG